MVKSEILYGVLASLIAGLVILNIPIISEDYWTQPKFKAQVNNIETSDGNFTQIKIFNEGASQAKEGFAAIDKKKNLILNYTTCHEGNIVSDNEEQTKINFERLSTGINCHVFYNEHNKFNIDRIIVSAEDSPGYTWTPEKIFEDITNILTMVLLLEVVLGGSATYLGIRLMQRYRSKKHKTRKLKVFQEDLTNQLNELQSEYNSIKDEQIHTTDKNKKEEHNKKASELSERIQDIKSELDNVKIQMALENNSDEVLGRFHKNMMVLEHEIIKKAKENGIQFTALIIAPSVIIRKMNDANLISDERKEQFNSIRSFRNRITHGTISPTDKEIESQIKSIIELTDVIKKIK